MRKKTRLTEISKLAYNIFSHFTARQWIAAEAELKALRNCSVTKGKEWMKGYIDGVEGMLRALRDRRVSLPPLLHTIPDLSQKELKLLQRKFFQQSRSPLNTLHDQGFFRVWYDYVKYLEDTTSTMSITSEETNDQ
jgi:hypothetical protein